MERYRLHLTEKQLNELIDILESYDHLCDCENFPDCEDFKTYQKLKSRVKSLQERANSNRINGIWSFKTLRRGFISEGIRISADVRKREE